MGFHVHGPDEATKGVGNYEKNLPNFVKPQAALLGIDGTAPCSRLRTGPGSESEIGFSNQLALSATSRGGARSRVVRYGDFVQAHALCEAIASLVGPVYVADIGAYHGSYAVLLGSLIAANGGKVLAVEPNPLSCDLLRDNVRRNQLGATVIVEQCAISDVDGGLLGLLLRGSQSQILKEEGESRDQSAVKLRRLDSLLFEHKIPRLDILVVDVEGAELEVLRSVPWDQAKPPTVLCELHCNEWPLFGYSAREFSEFLDSHGLICVDTYLVRHRDFSNKAYLGPCLLLPEE